MAAASSYFDQVQKIYIAFYQRPADPNGLLYWSQRVVADGGDVSAVIDAFASSPEAAALYPAVATRAEKEKAVGDIYQALFGRSIDAEGKAWYVGKLEDGTYTIGKVALEIMNGAKNDDVLAINNKAAVANTFTAIVDGRAMTDVEFGTGSSFAASYGGSADEAAARAFLAKVTAQPATMPSKVMVIGEIQAKIANAGDLILNMQGNLTLAVSGAANVVDNLTGTSGDDIFLARTVNNVNTLNDGDRINAGDGEDTLYADMVGNTNGVAITPIFTNLENVVIRAQSTTRDSHNSNNMFDDLVQIDAQRSLGVDVADHVTAAKGVVRWESNNSRSDVVIEDVRIGKSQKTSDVTIAMVETDPGNVDFGVYFNQQSLRNAGASTSSLKIFVMDTQSVKKGGNPLEDAAFYGFRFTTDSGAAVSLGGKDSPDAKAIQDAKTYEQLEAAFNAALKSQKLETKYQVKLFSTTDMTAEVLKDAETADQKTQASSFENQPGKYLVLTSTSETFPKNATAYAWLYEEGSTAPSVGSIAQSFNAGATSTTELVTSKIILDDVGLGSTGGDLVVGGMSVGDTSTSRGVERFEIEVRDNSKLQTINSTNNALREVTIVNGATSKTVGDAYTTTVKDEGNLTVNGDANVLPSSGAMAAGGNNILPGVDDNSPNGVHHGAGAAGFTDVRLIDASAFKGRLEFTAAITADSLTKYVTQVDSQPNPAGDVAGSGNVNFNVPGANFIYTGGIDNDTMKVMVDSSVAASRSSVVSGQSDFTFVVDGNDGNDSIELDLVTGGNRGATPLIGGNEAWYTNQKQNANITINGGAGSDTIRTPGAGDVVINSGADNDVVYTDNTGTSVQSWATATAATSNARWVFNTADQSKSLAAERKISDLKSDVNNSNPLYGTKVTVTFKDLTATAVVDHTNYKSTDLQINQAIKKAINTDAVLSKLLVAQDGPANSLVVTALSDGQRLVGDLKVVLTSPDVTTLGGVVTAFNTANKTTYADAAALKAGLDQTIATFNSKGDYASALANDGAANLTGLNSISSSDNTITPGTGNDVVVLGTTSQGSLLTSSNETIVYGAGFGDDTIVNFDATYYSGYTQKWDGGTYEIITLAFTASDGSPAAQTIVFDGSTITLSAPATQGVIPAADVASQFAHQYAGANWMVVSEPNHAGGVVVLQRKAPGEVKDVTAADLTGTYFGAANGNGSVTVAVTQDGQNIPVAGSAATFTVTFDAKATAAVSTAGSMTFANATVSYAAGDGSLTLANKVAATQFQGWTLANQSHSSSGDSVTFVANAAGSKTTVPTEAQFLVDAGSASDGIVGTLVTTAGTDATTKVPTATVISPGPGMGYDMLDFTAFGGIGAKFGTTLTEDQSITVAALTTANNTAALVGGLFSADNTAAQTHVYVAADTTTNIGTVYSVVDPVGASNAVATKQGTIDLADTMWSTLTSVNFKGNTYSEAGRMPNPTFKVSSAATVNETNSSGVSGTATFTITTTEVPNGTQLAYALSGQVNAADLPANTAMSGTVTIMNNTATVTVPLASDASSEGSETLRLDLLLNGQTVANGSTQVVDSSPNAGTYTLTPPVSVNEGTKASFALATTGVPAGTEVAYTLGGGINVDDLASGGLTGKVTLSASGAATIEVDLKNDNTAEGSEILQVSLDGRNVSAQTTVNDTSKPGPSYAVAAGATSNNEGSNATFTVTTTNVNNGTVLNYTLSGTGITTADVTGGALTGTVTINNNTGTITVPLAADLSTNEGNETLRIDLATTAGGTSMANASTTIADTSTASAFTNVDLSTGTVAGTAAAEAFVYDYKMVNGRPTKAGDGEVTITGFDTTKDKLVFNDTGTGTVFTQAQFLALPGVVAADDPFVTQATFYVDPDNGVSGGVTVTGVAMAAVTIETLA